MLFLASALTWALLSGPLALALVPASEPVSELVSEEEEEASALVLPLCSCSRRPSASIDRH